MNVFLFVVILLVNIAVTSVALLIGTFVTDVPGSGVKEFLFGYLLIQGFPLLLLWIATYYLLDWRQKNSEMMREQSLTIIIGNFMALTSLIKPIGISSAYIPSNFNLEQMKKIIK